MTGTSIDGIDTAAVSVRGRGLRARVTLCGQAHAPLGALTERLRSAQRQFPLTAGEFVALARDLAIAHIAPLRQLAETHGAPDLIALHGQTLFHQPPDSLQLIDASVVAHAFGCSVISNLRAVDLAAGGQGAPITPLSDWMSFRAKKSWRVVINLGGFCNATVIPPEPIERSDWIGSVRGFDLCLCNQLLDHLARTRANAPFDADGRIAAAGKVHAAPLTALRAHLDQQRRAGRSLGTADEILAAGSSALADLNPSDALATATRGICETIAAGILEPCPAFASGASVKVLVAGGGAKNPCLMHELSRAFGKRVHTTDSVGIPAEARETIAMAVLGTLAADGVSITLPAVTHRGATQVLDGCLLRANPARP